MYGSFIQPSKRWLGGFTEVSGPQVGQVPPEELRVDPNLPGVATDPYDPAGSIAIAAGRFVAIGYANTNAAASYDTTGTAASVNTYRMGQSDRGATVLTLHDGSNLTPVGLSVNNMFKSTGQLTSGNPVSGGSYWNTGDTFATDSGASASDTKFRRGFLATVPFVLQVNNSHGAVVAGDMLTGYWGSTTSTTGSNIAWQHRGKPVKWTARTMRYQTFSASGSVVLTEAIYPGMTPRVVSILNVSTPVTGTTTLAFNGTNWVATLPGTATQVYYEYGQGPEMIGGACVRIQSLTEVMSREVLFKFVEVARQDYVNYPPATQRVAVTPRVQEVANAVVAGSVYRVLNPWVSVNHSVLIEIQGTVADPATGVQTTYSASNWFALPSGPSLSLVAGLVGPYHNLNWRTGVIELSANIVATSVRVTYSSVANTKGAVVWGAGIEGQTDGRYLTAGLASASGMVPTNRAGVPAYLNFADVVGEMKFLVND